MDVPEPVYLWLLRLKSQLTAERGRVVTYPEVWEYVKAAYEAQEVAR